jgi:hypothetical protein
LIWRSYVLFELAVDDAARAKMVFFKGLTRLPWVKGYMMLAFTRLRDILTLGEMSRVYNVMFEKGLRVHVDMQGFFDEVDETREMNAEG